MIRGRASSLAVGRSQRINSKPLTSNQAQFADLGVMIDLKSRRFTAISKLAERVFAERKGPPRVIANSSGEPPEQASHANLRLQNLMLLLILIGANDPLRSQMHCEPMPHLDLQRFFIASLRD